jgi:hypothetical protein
MWGITAVIRYHGIKLQKKPKEAIAQQSSLLNTSAGQYISFRT